MTAKVVCALSDLEEQDARGYQLTSSSGESVPVILVRNGPRVFAYRNACPHTGLNLEWQPDRFFDVDGVFLQCAVHGALFRPEDGYCVRGPCAGESLEALDVRVHGGKVIVRL